MDLTVTPLMIYSAMAIGSVSAYLAYKRGKNPYLWFGLGFLFGIFGIFALFFSAPKRKRNPAPATERILVIQGPSDKFWYYLDGANQQQGPVSRDGLTAAWKEGKVDPSTYVWHEELPDWQPLKASIKKITKKL